MAKIVDIPEPGTWRVSCTNSACRATLDITIADIYNGFADWHVGPGDYDESWIEWRLAATCPACGEEFFLEDHMRRTMLHPRPDVATLRYRFVDERGRFHDLAKEPTEAQMHRFSR